MGIRILPAQPAQADEANRLLREGYRLDGLSKDGYLVFSQDHGLSTEDLDLAEQALAALGAVFEKLRATTGDGARIVAGDNPAAVCGLCAHFAPMGDPSSKGVVPGTCALKGWSTPSTGSCPDFEDRV